MANTNKHTQSMQCSVYRISTSLFLWVDFFPWLAVGGYECDHTYTHRDKIVAAFIVAEPKTKTETKLLKMGKSGNQKSKKNMNKLHR